MMKKRDVYNWSLRKMRGKRDEEDEPVRDVPLWQQVFDWLVILGLCGFLIWLVLFAPY